MGSRPETLMYERSLGAMVIALLCCSSSLADVVTTTGGRRLDCVILQENAEGVTVRRGYGTMEITPPTDTDAYGVGGSLRTTKNSWTLPGRRRRSSTRSRSRERGQAARSRNGTRRSSLQRRPRSSRRRPIPPKTCRHGHRLTSRGHGYRKRPQLAAASTCAATPGATAPMSAHTPGAIHTVVAATVIADRCYRWHIKALFGDAVAHVC
jgi:hypothetical protein